MGKEVKWKIFYFRGSPADYLTCYILQKNALKMVQCAALIAPYVSRQSDGGS